MTAVWILVFWFNGMPVASGPHDLDVCLEMAALAQQAHCWNPHKPWERRKSPILPKVTEAPSDPVPPSKENP